VLFTIYPNPRLGGHRILSEVASIAKIIIISCSLLFTHRRLKSDLHFLLYSSSRVRLARLGYDDYCYQW